MKPLCLDDVERYADRYLALSELDSVNRCNGDVQCLVQKVAIQRAMRDHNNYQSYMLLEYLVKMSRAAQEKEPRRLAVAFAFLKYSEREDQWYSATANLSGAADATVRAVLAEVWVERMGADADECRRNFHVVLLVQEAASPMVSVIPFDPEGAVIMDRFPVQRFVDRPAHPVVDGGHAPYVALLWFHVACVTNTAISDAILHNRSQTGSYLFELHLVDALLPPNVDVVAFEHWLYKEHNEWRTAIARADMPVYRRL